MIDSSPREISSHLLQQKIKGWEIIGGGKNSQVYSATTEDDSRYAIKFYFQDTRKRLDVEFQGLSFLWNHGVKNIPQPLLRDDQNHCGVYSFVSGEKLLSPSSEDVGQMLFFVERLYSLSKKEEAIRLPTASDACFSFSSTLEIIERRLQRLRSTERDGESYLLLHQFLNEQFIPLYQRLRKSEEKAENREVTVVERTLSPSDFGFHNALQTTMGDLFFLDFEYFGWDDPAKMISDALLHPGMNLSVPLQQQFLDRALLIFNDQPQLRERVKRAIPFYGLIWCLILLNEFILEEQQRRAFAAGRAVETAILKLQLQKAESLLHKINKGEIFAPFSNEIASR